MDKNTHPLLTLPGAIIIAGAIIAIAIIWTKKPAEAPVAARTTPQLGQQVSLAAVTSADHIFGNPNAPVKIVEYSDPSCPFCKVFHSTMKRIATEYGPSGKVAWIYRHFPLDKADGNGNVLHPNAGHEAQAMECAAALGGNDAFWKFTNRFYDVTPSVTSESPAGFDQKQLPTIAKESGLDPVAFNDCLTSGRFKDKVEKQYIEGLNAGVAGTPYSIIITPSGTMVPLQGAQPYNTVKNAIDALLSQSEGK